MALALKTHASDTRAAIDDLVAVCREYCGAVRLELRAVRSVGKRTAFAGLMASTLALVVVGFVAPATARSLLLFPLVAVALSAVAAWFATDELDAAVAERERTVRAELDALSDQRVALVIRQFEWTINDLETLRRTVRAAEAAKKAAEARSVELEKRIRQYRQMLDGAQTQLAALRAEPVRLPKAEPQPELAPADGVVFRWGLHDNGTLQWLELEGDALEASRIRLLDPDGAVVTLSDRAKPIARTDGRLAVAIHMNVPAEIVAALASGAPLAHRFEAIVGETWQAVRLVDTGARTGIARDKRGRSYVAEGARAVAS